MLFSTWVKSLRRSSFSRTASLKRLYLSRDGMRIPVTYAMKPSGLIKYTGTYSLTYLPAYSLIYLLTYLLTHSPTHSLTHFTQWRYIRRVSFLPWRGTFLACRGHQPVRAVGAGARVLPQDVGARLIAVYLGAALLTQVPQRICHLFLVCYACGYCN